MKKFVDIDNLRVVWDEINKRFVRMRDISDQLYLLEDELFESSTSVQLQPGAHWDNIDKDYYDLFIEFVNSNHSKKYVLDSSGVFWTVICKAFYDVYLENFTGCILSSNTNDGDVYFWYIRATKNEDNDEYSLDWNKYIGELPSATAVSASKFDKEINSIRQLIYDLGDRITVLESYHGISQDSTPSNTPPTTDEKYHRIICYIRTQNGSKLTNASIINLNYTNKVSNKDYVIPDEPISNNLEWTKVDDRFEFLIKEPYAVELTIKCSGYENQSIKIAYDSTDTSRAVIMYQSTTPTPTPEPDNSNTPRAK